jgi:DnaJ-class molecular chaperone
MFKLVAEAFEVLSDHEKRKEYDMYGFQTEPSSNSYDNQSHRGKHYSERSGYRGHGHFSDMQHAFDLFNSFFDSMDRDFGHMNHRGFGGASRDPFASDPFFSSAFMGHSMMSRDPFFSDSMRSMHEMMSSHHNMASSFSQQSASGNRRMVGTSTSQHTVISSDGTRTTRKETTITYPDGRQETNVEEFTEPPPHGHRNRLLEASNPNSRRIPIRNSSTYNTLK